MTTTAAHATLGPTFGQMAEYRPFPSERGRNLRQEWFEVPAMVLALRLSPGRRILEVGCGRGVALPELYRILSPTRITGIDIDAEALDAAAENARRRGAVIELIPADVRSLPFPDASFDIVVDFGTCYHIARPEAALREIARVLSPGGIFAHETRINQFLSHPVRSLGRRLPTEASRLFRQRRRAILWSSRTTAA